MNNKLYTSKEFKIVRNKIFRNYRDKLCYKKKMLTQRPNEGQIKTKIRTTSTDFMMSLQFLSTVEKRLPSSGICDIMSADPKIGSR